LNVADPSSSPFCRIMKPAFMSIFLDAGQILGRAGSGMYISPSNACEYS
jgi:hypothetical protein